MSLIISLKTDLTPITHPLVSDGKAGERKVGREREKKKRGLSWDRFLLVFFRKKKVLQGWENWHFFDFA